jgi:hypothetical protein
MKLEKEWIKELREKANENCFYSDDAASLLDYAEELEAELAVFKAKYAGLVKAVEKAVSVKEDDSADYISLRLAADDLETALAAVKEKK